VLRRCCRQESFINISVPKIDKDYSLYRTYVIFRTLGLRHLVVVDVHNHVVGLITRKDVMPFKMQERLESLLEQTTTLNPDPEFGFKPDEQKTSVDSGKGSSYGDKPVVSARLSNVSYQSVDTAFPAITKTLSGSNISKIGPEEDGDTQSTASAAATDAEVGDVCPDSDSLPPAVLVTISPPEDDEDDDVSELEEDNEIDPARLESAAAAADEIDEGQDSDASIPVVVTIHPPDNDKNDTADRATPP